MQMTYKDKQKALIDSIESDFNCGLSPSTIVPITQDYQNDNRIGLTSVILLPQNIQNIIIEKVIKPLKEIDPNQYYYPPPNSLHITIFCIKSVNNPITYTQRDIEIVEKVFSEVIPKYQKFNFEIRGLFDLPTSLGIRAYSDEIFGGLVQELREKIRKQGVVDDKILASNEIFFSNITICRHRRETNSDYKNWIIENKDLYFGNVEAEDVYLATSNVTFQPHKTKVITKFKLK